jgi:hypothetical protein
VVVFDQSGVYLLETTDKRRLKNWRHYPLADLSAQYRGTEMFNQYYFWIYTGHLPSMNYRSEAWVKTSRYFTSLH